jgi:hypothetical protein
MDNDEVNQLLVRIGREDQEGADGLPCAAA